MRPRSSSRRRSIRAAASPRARSAATWTGSSTSCWRHCEPLADRPARPRPTRSRCSGPPGPCAGTTIRKLLGGVGGQREHPLGLLVLAGRAQLLGVVAEQVLDVEQALGVEVLRARLWRPRRAGARSPRGRCRRRCRGRRRGRRSSRRRPRARCRRARRRGPRSCTRRRSPWRWRGRRCSRGCRRSRPPARRRGRRRRRRGGCRSASRPSPGRRAGRAGRRRRTTCRPSR